jgi:hypothetical protein
MMGRSHACSGAALGMLLARLTGHHDIPSAAVIAVTTAGFALLPDLDCGSATASRLLGPITGTLSRLLRFMSRHLYAWTKGPRDEDWEGTHRHMTHTVLFALLLGAGTLGGEHLWGQWWVAGTAATGIILAAAALGDWVLVPALGGIGWLILGGQWGHSLAGAGWAIALSVTVGCICHCLGDALTLMGCPFLFPLMIAGESWFELRPPPLLRFRTGGGVESILVFPALCAGCVLLTPGVWEHLLQLVASVG